MKRATAPPLRPKKTAVVAGSDTGKGLGSLPVPVSHPDKIYWPDEGYTKLDLIQFYSTIFPKLLPYVRDRILSLERCPEGMAGSCFFQKEIPKGMPSGTPTKRIRHAGGSRETTNYVVGGSLATQLALVNLGCIAVHVTASRASAPRRADWLCIDIDPQSGEFAAAVEAALYVKESMDRLRLQAFVKTSGSRGLHVFVPLAGGPDADDVLGFAEAFVARVASAHPKQLTVEHAIAARGKRVYLDPFRNGFGQTVVAPYSVRRRPHAPVSIPLQWRQLKSSLQPADFNIGNLATWSRRADPWKAFFDAPQNLEEAARALKDS